MQKDRLARRNICCNRRRRAENGLRYTLRRGRDVLVGGLKRVSVDISRFGTAGVRIRHLRTATVITHLQAAILFRLAHLFAGQSTSNERRRQHQQRHAQADEFTERDHVSIVDEMAAVDVSQVTFLLALIV